jgi:hypothetical protein
MNSPFLCLFFAFACFKTDAQNYFAIRNDGDIHKGYFLDQVYDEGTQRLLTFPSNDLFSPTINIPFPFQFYGTQYQQLKQLMVLLHLIIVMLQTPLLVLHLC